MKNTIDKILTRIIQFKFIQPLHDKSHFLERINGKGKLLDVGCGNNSPYFIKTLLPEIHYTGIDIGDYNQTQLNLADEYIISTPIKFSDDIANMGESFDTVISSHNLEHCNDREKTLDAIISVLKPGGWLFLAFPTEKSVKFPGYREGCLNYYDDSTHKDSPPSFRQVLGKLKENKLKIVFASKSYKTFFFYIIDMYRNMGILGI